MTAHVVGPTAELIYDSSFWELNWKILALYDSSYRELNWKILAGFYEGNMITIVNIVWWWPLTVWKPHWKHMLSLNFFKALAIKQIV